MTLQHFVEAMPKFELNVHLEGAFDKNRLTLIAEQYDIHETLKHFQDWVKLIQTPDYNRLLDIVRIANSWIREGDDLSRIAYDLGTQLSKQNVKYAEVSVCPALYSELGLDLEGFFSALNDGRDRAERAWGVRMSWVLTVPRDEPRRAEDVVRWASSLPGRRANVIGIGVTGRDDVQPAGQFEKAFRSAEKHGLARSIRVGEKTGATGTMDSLQVLKPTRLVDARGIWDNSVALERASDEHVAVLFSPSRMIKHHWLPDHGSGAVRQLYDANIVLVVGTDMPTFYQTTINQEYRMLVENFGLSSAELEQVALYAVQASAIDADVKERTIEEFTAEYAKLRQEFLSSEEQPT